ncbi:MAG: hypothetical protein MO846_09580 [Candidatus Devosia symbiotica]|nr:hypothetical protein [Candidatus Devosia symbiotica]
MEADDFGVSWACPVSKGYSLLVREGDLRFALNYGFDTGPDPQFSTVPPFNMLEAKLEWRLSNELGRGMPIATIVRYHTSSENGTETEGQMLMIIQLAPGNSCSIAYVDACANSDANELTRQAADAAGGFDCAHDEIKTLGSAQGLVDMVGMAGISAPCLAL